MTFAMFDIGNVSIDGTDQLKLFARVTHSSISFSFCFLSLSSTILPNSSSTILSVAREALSRVNCLAFLRQVWQSLRQKLAMTLSRGSSGSGVRMSPQTQSMICRKVRAGEQLRSKTEWQMRPCEFMLQWQMGVMKRTSGALKGQSPGNCAYSRKRPFSQGVSLGPSNRIFHRLILAHGKIATKGWGLSLQFWISLAIRFKLPLPDIFLAYPSFCSFLTMSFAEMPPPCASGILNSWTVLGKSKGSSFALMILSQIDNLWMLSSTFLARTLRTVSCSKSFKLSSRLRVRQHFPPDAMERVFSPSQLAPTAKESITILLSISNLVVSSTECFEPVSYPSVRATILSKQSGQLIWNFLRASAAVTTASNMRVDPRGAALAMSLLKSQMASVNPHWFSTLWSKKKSETTCYRLQAMVLKANAQKKDLTAPILLKSGSLKNWLPIDPDTSNKTAMASLGGRVMTGLRLLRSIAYSTFSLRTLAPIKSRLTASSLPVSTSNRLQGLAMSLFLLTNTLSLPSLVFNSRQTNDLFFTSSG